MVEGSTSQIKKEDKFLEAVRLVWNRRAAILALLGGIGFAVIGIATNLMSTEQKTESFWWIIGLTIFSLACSAKGGWDSWQNEQDRHDLKEQKARAIDEKLRFKAVPLTLLRHFLIFISKALGFNNKHRISVYLHVGKDFNRIGRYSENPNYDKAGRKLYPENQGCIAKAWEQGTFQDVLPDPKNLEEYKKVLEERYNIDSKTADNLTMKSRSYVGIRLTDPRTRLHRGVIIFETTLATNVNLGTVQNIFDKEKEEELAKYISEFLPWLPKSD